MKKALSDCSQCPYKHEERLCKRADGKFPDECPTKNKSHLLDECLSEYAKPEIREFARQASIQEGEGYGDKDLGYARVRPVNPRIKEIAEFAQKMKYKRLGLAFCGALRKEAKIVGDFFSSYGFDVVSITCKAGRVPKEQIGILDHQKVRIGGFEAMCNPIFQAHVLNEEKTEFNVLLGLCVGHDSLFLKHADTLCTVLAVKDRLLCHNPLAAVYNIDHLYRYLKPS